MVVLLDPGELRSELALEAMTPVPDGAGGYAESWSEIGLVFARIEPVQARERFGAGQTLEEVTHRITLRQRGDIASGMRFRRGARIFAILTVHDPDETERYLVCRVREEGR